MSEDDLQYIDELTRGHGTRYSAAVLKCVAEVRRLQALDVERCREIERLRRLEAQSIEDWKALRAQLATAREEALEEAAKAIEAYTERNTHPASERRRVHMDTASLVRALIAKPAPAAMPEGHALIAPQPSGAPAAALNAFGKALQDFHEMPDGTPAATCVTCKGSGRLQRVTGDFIYEKKDCPDCGGSGVRR